MGTDNRLNTRVALVGTDTGIAIEHALEERGVSVDVVRSIDDCLAHLERVDCVVIAGSVRDADPVECCRAIRETSDAPIVVFPDDGSETLAGAVVAAGADGYVPRDQGVETLVTRLDAVRDNQSSTTRTAADATDTGSPEPAENPSSRLELLVEQSPLAIIEWNLAFEVRNWNPAATELFGYTADEARGESAIDLLVRDDERREILEYWDVLTSGDADGQPSRQVNRNVDRDGTPITCEWVNTPLVEDGEIVGVLSFGQDITAERKRANALEALQETTHDLIRAESTDAIADIVIAATEAVLDRPLAAIRFYDEETETLKLAGASPALEEHTGDITSIGPSNSRIWETYVSGEPTVLENASADRIPYEIETEVRNSVLQPLGDHGMLAVASSGEDELDDAERHLIHVLATTAEAALDRAARERELERTKAVVETVGDCVYQLDLESRFVTVNETMAMATGYSRDELIGTHVSAILTDESVERCRRHTRALLSDDEQRVVTDEVTLTGPDDERLPCEVNMALLRSDGDVEGTVGIARDISDRKRMERKLVDRKAKIESLHDIASRLDDCESRAELDELTVEAAEDVLNFDVCCVALAREESLVPAAISSTLEVDLDATIPIDDDLAGRCYRTRQSVRVDELDGYPNSIRSDGDDCQSALCVPIGDRGVFLAGSTEPAAFTSADEELAELLLSHVTDALDRIAFEERLRTERDRFAALFENVPDAVVNVAHLEDGPIVEAINPAFERIFGYDEEDLVGNSLDQYIVPAERMANAETLNRRGSRGEIGEAEVKRQTANGLRDFRLRVVPMQMDGSSDRAFGHYTDITAQKQRQKRLEILNRVLRHDLRNGMNIINGCAEMLTDTIDDGNHEYVETIRNRANELTGLAEKTRAVERVLDREEIPAGPIDLSAAVDRAAARLERTHDEVDITCSLPEQTFARADEYLQTAVFQILENAVEHSDRANPTIDVTLRDRPDDELVTVSIADDGPGMPSEERELLEGDRKITQLRHGSGLGLWLVNWIVRQAGGTLSFSDNDPRGTVVRLEVPRADTETVRAAVDETATGD
ncbi:PAS domain S-box protein [Natrinema zhouii]|uniref:histidine kinase n=1 Tax=Natrinema zhouii TaxID=1710539 RepID=A0A7D6GQL2_9EURY|nr:PAS domain S-box protein [Natrinema zhouii]QLK25183.1 PAS domain S-box protein [Natrinema zhouii]